MSQKIQNWLCQSNIVLTNYAQHNNQGCECKDFIDSNGWGNCIKTSKGRPMCFVEDPSASTCKDLVDFPGGPGEKGSFEACEQNCMSILDTRNRFILWFFLITHIQTIRANIIFFYFP